MKHSEEQSGITKMNKTFFSRFSRWEINHVPISSLSLSIKVLDAY